MTQSRSQTPLDGKGTSKSIAVDTRDDRKRVTVDGVDHFEQAVGVGATWRVFKLHSAIEQPTKETQENLEDDTWAHDIRTSK